MTESWRTHAADPGPPPALRPQREPRYCFAQCRQVTRHTFARGEWRCGTCGAVHTPPTTCGHCGGPLPYRPSSHLRPGNELVLVCNWKCSVLLSAKDGDPQATVIAQRMGWIETPVVEEAQTS